MKHETVRDVLVHQAEVAFIVLTTQVDHLLDLVSFYLDRYPFDGTESSLLKTSELKTTIDNMASLSSQLAEVVSRWKSGDDRVLSRTGTEISILNELCVNINSLCYFLVWEEIDLEPFDLGQAEDAVHILVRSNRLLT